MNNEPNIYNELAHIETLREHVKANQDQILDIYDTDHEKIELMNKLLVEMNDLLVEIDEVDAEMQELMKQL